MTPGQQLMVLTMNVETLEASSKSRKLKSFRMTGVNQSYDMFDGRVYHSAQMMKKIVQKEKIDVPSSEYATAKDESMSAPLVSNKAKGNTVAVAPAPVQILDNGTVELTTPVIPE